MLSTCLATIAAAGDDYYLIDEYINDLDIRDALEDVRAALPAASQAGFGALLEQLDQRFKEVTVDDGGDALHDQVSHPAASGMRSLDGWWWRRRPIVLPWQE